MSTKFSLLSIEPDKHNEQNKGEIFTFDGLDCPTCNGYGYFDFSGWMQKFKDDQSEPDFKMCTRCKGTGKLTAKVVVGWMPADSPVLCPQE